MAGRVKLGYFGGDGGNHHDINGYPTRVTKIVIRSSDVIDSLAYEYVEDGKTFSVGPWGGSGGTSTTIEFQPGEFLTAIDGSMGDFHGISDLVKSLSFSTNVRNYGPFGIAGETPFSIPIQSGRVVAFYGRSATYVNAIGIYLLPS
ncbi:salt stress-induced protein-like isoform X3 [Ananas comosus]|uniref:Salt stress-induced protein-like isoform X3 n=1 Tax=Ananas comosus TaxID=4615 RepID=A0A6P5G7P2_ANACO|nr:salt stress-induced protein-like isoform X3 [Ananas comosus]